MDDVDLAHHLADVATSAAAPYLSVRPPAVVKPDGSAVTEADLVIEAALLRELALWRPGDAVLSEESGAVPAPLGAARPEGRPRRPEDGSGRRWVLDPLDGTEAFLAGQRGWGTHVALQVDGARVLGVITRPTEGRRWWAVLGQGAWTRADADDGDGDGAAGGGPVGRRGRRLQVSDRALLPDARVGGYATEASALAQAVARRARWVPDPLSPVLALAEGRLKAVIATGGEVWDHAPQVLLVAEAGGAFVDPDGGQRPDRGGGLYSNGRVDPADLYAELLRARSGPRVD